MDEELKKKLHSIICFYWDHIKKYYGADVKDEAVWDTLVAEENEFLEQFKGDFDLEKLVIKMAGCIDEYIVSESKKRKTND